MKKTIIMHILILVLFLLLVLTVSAKSYFESDEYKELMGVQVGEVISAKGKGVYISRGEETDNTVVFGDKVYCNDAINTQYEGDEIKVKNLKTGNVFNIKYPQDLPLNQIQQFGFNGMDLPPMFAQYAEFSCVDVVKKCGFFGKIFKKCEQETKVEEKPNRGMVMFKKGRVLIERGIDIIPADVGTIVKVGDTVIVEEGAEVRLDTGLIVSQKSKFTIEDETISKTEPSKIYLLFGNAWKKMKIFLKLEHFEKEERGTADVGRRG